MKVKLDPIFPICNDCGKTMYGNGIRLTNYYLHFWCWITGGYFRCEKRWKEHVKDLPDDFFK